METNAAAIAMIGGEWCCRGPSSDCPHRWDRKSGLFLMRSFGRAWIPTALGNSSDWRIVPKCRECEGEGKVRDWGFSEELVTCPGCDGKGIQPEPPEPESEFEEWEAELCMGSLNFVDSAKFRHPPHEVQRDVTRFHRFKFEREGRVIYATVAPLLWSPYAKLTFEVTTRQPSDSSVETIWPVAAIMRVKAKDA